MSDAAISVTGLGKRYWLSQRSRSDTLRDAVTAKLRALGARLAGRESHGAEEEFWALRDLSFEIARGDVVGIIGRNGAGKSTLLKILSRITDPTAGEIRIRGRVASLLEVGTGFHPELTGRDNIYLNGAILGMSRAEIRRKFDEIVAFAEVERFLDMRVKHYSSGMYVRLAFAVAAHLEPEILIVDEVLAVGDAAFQKKCLGKMQDVARSEGRTVLFVSHNLPSIRQLCRSALLLSGGRLEAAGGCGQVLEQYQRGLTAGAPVTVPKPGPDLAERAYVTAVVLETLDGRQPAVIPVGVPWRIRLAIRVRQPQRRFVAAVGIKSADGIAVQTAWLPPQDLAAGDYEAVFTQDRVNLEGGSYSLLVGLTENDRQLQQFEAARFDLTGENAGEEFPATSGVGIVLNSMQSRLTRV